MVDYSEYGEPLNKLLNALLESRNNNHTEIKSYFSIVQLSPVKQTFSIIKIQKQSSKIVDQMIIPIMYVLELFFHKIIRIRYLIPRTIVKRNLAESFCGWITSSPAKVFSIEEQPRSMNRSSWTVMRDGNYLVFVN